MKKDGVGAPSPVHSRCPFRLKAITGGFPRRSSRSPQPGNPTCRPIGHQSHALLQEFPAYAPSPLTR